MTGSTIVTRAEKDAPILTEHEPHVIFEVLAPVQMRHLDETFEQILGEAFTLIARPIHLRGVLRKVRNPSKGSMEDWIVVIADESIYGLPETNFRNFQKLEKIEVIEYQL